MQLSTTFRVVAFSVVSLIINACGGGGDDSSSNAPAITVTDCSPVAGDSTQNMDGSTNFTKSYLLGTPVYRIVTSRQLSDTTEVTVDYMVHEPTGTPTGIVMLFAGGGLDAGIEGTVDGDSPTNSKGNFLVRSAHRYQALGYRVITIDRPSDYANYGPFNVDMDNYRNSMKHAVDIATILQRENTEDYNVIFSGTSRGSISVAANNTLAAGIAMSSSLTSRPAGSTTGSPVGSAELPLSVIQRESHVLLHSLDGCEYTTPADSRALYEALYAQGTGAVANEVTGGFQDTTRNDVCGAFDYHGYVGIEMCAVTKETVWMDNLINGLGSNSPPVADNQSVNQGDTITLTATDADVDTLTFAVPYASSSLGGSVSTDANGNVSYTPPVGANGAIDKFAFTVTDGNGGVSTGVVSIQLTP